MRPPVDVAAVSNKDAGSGLGGRCPSVTRATLATLLYWLEDVGGALSVYPGGGRRGGADPAIGAADAVGGGGGDAARAGAGVGEQARRGCGLDKSNAEYCAERVGRNNLLFELNI